MVKNFSFFLPTRIVFGLNIAEKVGEEAAEMKLFSNLSYGDI
jgi:hypothetical protein